MINKVKITLSKDLREKLKIRQFPVMKGDLVEVVKGGRKGEGGKVSMVDHRHGMIVIEGLNIAKADGKEKAYEIAPEKVVIKKLDLSDSKREDRLKALAAAKDVSLTEEIIEETKVIPEPEEVEESQTPESEAEENSTQEEEEAPEENEESESDGNLEEEKEDDNEE